LHRDMNTSDGTTSQAPSTPDSGVNPPGSLQSPLGNRPQSPSTPANPNAVIPAMMVDQFHAIIAALVPAQPQVQVQTRERERSAARSPKAAALMAAAGMLPKLKEDSYAGWVFAVSDVIKNTRLWDHVTGQTVRPNATDTRNRDRFDQEAGAVRTVIMGALTHEQSYCYLEGTTTA
jgi:hypothetical protein